MKRLEGKVKKKNDAGRLNESCNNDSSSSRNCREKISRRSIDAVDWKQCIFCQLDRPKDHLVSIMTFGMSDRILKDAPYDPGMSIGLVNVNDLIASEGKYHLICLRGFEMKIVKRKKGSYQYTIWRYCLWLKCTLTEKWKPVK